MAYFSWGFNAAHTHQNIFLNMFECANVKMLRARSLWSGSSSCMARVTSSSSMLVGMWRVWLRPAHKTLHPGTVLLPLQTEKQQPMGKPHRRLKLRASLHCCFFQLWTCSSSADLQVRTFKDILAAVIFWLCDQFHFNKKKNSSAIKVTFAYLIW